MPPPGENKKRKNDDPSPASQPQSDTASVLSNLPALPPPPDASPPPTSQQTAQPSGQTSGVPPHTSVTATSAHPTASGKSRPKRARSKADKKEDNERQSRFHCDYCARDLSSAVRARCAVCPDYDSCLDCFSVGAALKPHSADHAYRLIEVVHTAIYQEGWGADEEEKLIEGLEIYGVGNWEQVAKLIGSKNPLETEQHFMKVYLQSAMAPLPDQQKLLTVDSSATAKPHDDVDPKALRVMHMHQQEDAAGWMPKRQDFAYEWDNDAEDIIGDMEIGDDDTKADKELKLEVLKIYCQKLKEREKRKDFVHARTLTDVKTHQAVDKKRSKEERDFREKLKVFMRFVPHDDMEKFIKGMMDEREIRTRITMLKEGRKQGATTVEECERIHANHLKKQMRASGTSGPNGASAGTNATTPGGGEPSVLSTNSQRRARRSNGEASASEATGGAATGAATAAGANGYNSAPSGTDSKDRTIFHEVAVEAMPGAELLSATEIALCTSLRLIPHQYMIVKELMIRESARGGLRRRDARAIVKMDGAKVFKIYDYLQGCGWVRSASGGGGGAGVSSGNIGGGGSHGGVTGGGAANVPGRMVTSDSALTWNGTKSQTERS